MRWANAVPDSACATRQFKKLNGFTPPCAKWAAAGYCAPQYSITTLGPDRQYHTMPIGSYWCARTCGRCAGTPEEWGSLHGDNNIVAGGTGVYVWRVAPAESVRNSIGWLLELNVGAHYYALGPFSTQFKTARGTFVLPTDSELDMKGTLPDFDGSAHLQERRIPCLSFNVFSQETVNNVLSQWGVDIGVEHRGDGWYVYYWCGACNGGKGAGLPDLELQGVPPKFTQTPNPLIEHYSYPTATSIKVRKERAALPMPLHEPAGLQVSAGWDPGRPSPGSAACLQVTVNIESGQDSAGGHWDAVTGTFAFYEGGSLLNTEERRLQQPKLFALGRDGQPNVRFTRFMSFLPSVANGGEDGIQDMNDGTKMTARFENLALYTDLASTAPNEWTAVTAWHVETDNLPTVIIGTATPGAPANADTMEVMQRQWYL